MNFGKETENEVESLNESRLESPFNGNCWRRVGCSIGGERDEGEREKRKGRKRKKVSKVFENREEEKRKSTLTTFGSEREHRLYNRVTFDQLKT